MLWNLKLELERLLVYRSRHSRKQSICGGNIGYVSNMTLFWKISAVLNWGVFRSNVLAFTENSAVGKLANSCYI